MVDVVASLRSILPDGDVFHAVGGRNDMIMAMIAEATPATRAVAVSI